MEGVWVDDIIRDWYILWRRKDEHGCNQDIMQKGSILCVLWLREGCWIPPSPLQEMWVVSYSAEERDMDWEFYVEGHGFNGKLGLSAIKHGSEELWSWRSAWRWWSGRISRTVNVSGKLCRRYLAELPIKTIMSPNKKKTSSRTCRGKVLKEWKLANVQEEIHFNWKPLR